MKIKCECTKAEKELIIKALAEGAVCVYVADSTINCDMNCKNCIDKYIEWTITGEE